mmetsp:Transcript_27929/g.82096  ORF Transcript_27929/g.82096 Transcript_27929/m.82096 type:complete len:204 (+) Transcript_27929:4567-5178(+)
MTFGPTRSSRSSWRWPCNSNNMLSSSTNINITSSNSSASRSNTDSSSTIHGSSSNSKLNGNSSSSTWSTWRRRLPPTTAWGISPPASRTPRWWRMRLRLVHRPPGWRQRRLPGRRPRPRRFSNSRRSNKRSSRRQLCGSGLSRRGPVPWALRPRSSRRSYRVSWRRGWHRVSSNIRRSSNSSNSSTIAGTPHLTLGPSLGWWG